MGIISDTINNRFENSVAPFLWLHNEDDSKIIRELERIHSCGIRAVCVESRTHEEFCRDDWWSDMRLILDFCREHSMKVWILDDKHFPSGYANGYFEKHPELAQYNISENHIDVAGPVHDGCAFADVWCKDDDELLGVFACGHIADSDVLDGRIIDLSENVSGGNVYFDLPEGMWRIVFVIKTRRSLVGNLLFFSDKLNENSTQAYIDEVYQKHYDNLKEYFGNTLLGFFSDESCFGNNADSNEHRFYADIGRCFFSYPWSDGVADRFRELYGADWLKNLLPLWFDFDKIPFRDYRYEYMNFVSSEYARCYTKKIADWCHEHGVSYIGHVIEDNNAHYRTGQGAGHYFRALGAQDMSGVDVVLHQIVSGLTECASAGLVCYEHMDNRFFNYTLAKLGSSLAHITDHMHGRAMCEIFGAYGWAEDTRIMKYLTDHMLVRGINYFVPHAFSPKENDADCPPNFAAGGTNPQFKYFDRIIAYMNRMCGIMKRGVHVNTCAILYAAESEWTRAEYTACDDIAKALYDAQLDYDIIPSDALELLIDSDSICGEKYQLIAVPQSEYFRGDLRENLKKCSARIVVVGDSADDDFETVSVGGLANLVRACGYGDISCAEPDKNLRYCHRKGDCDIYMFFNESVSKTVDTSVALSDFDGGEYIVYDAFENKAVRHVSDDGSVKINLPPYNSCVVIVGADKSDFDIAEEYRERKYVSCETADCTYDISLCAEGGVYSHWRTTDRLVNITGREGIADFSGNIRYEMTVRLTGGNYVLDFGEVGQTAQLSVNGKKVGVRLFPPYSFDISEYVCDGDNRIELVVTNTLAPKLRDEFSKYLMIPPSGLIGPVTIKKY